ncbi:Hypothetical predicted protein [Argonauta hians]
MDFVEDISNTCKFECSQTDFLKLCDINEEEWKYSVSKDKKHTVRGKTSCNSEIVAPIIQDSFSENMDCIRNPPVKRRRFGIHNMNFNGNKDSVNNGEVSVDIEQFSQLSDVVRKKSWLLFRSMGNIPNPEVFKCKRFHFRRNAICDPFNLLMSQKHREVTERAAQKRKSSVLRKMKIFFQVRLNIDCEEDL